MLNLVMILGCALVGVDKTEDLKGCWKLHLAGQEIRRNASHSQPDGRTASDRSGHSTSRSEVDPRISGRPSCRGR